MDDLKIQIDRVVDQWVGEVLKTILHPETEPRKIGLWDRFKKGLTNLFYGQDNKKNPYYWQNRLGRMGVEESYGSPLSLSEYSEIKGVLDGAERLLSETEETDRLQIVRIIKGSADRLKGMLYDIFSKMQPAAPASAERPAASRPAVAPSASPPPAKLDEPPAAKGTSDMEGPEEDRAPRSHAARADGWFDEAAKAKSDDPSKIKPAKEWFDKNKVLRAEKIPSALAWMSHRTDKTDDEHIVNALRTELNDDSLEILPEGARNVGLLKYLKQRWFKMSDEALSGQLSKLGIDIRPKESGDKKVESKPKAEVKNEPERKKELTSKPEEKTKPERKREPTSSSKPDISSEQEPDYEKGSEPEIISRLYSRDGKTLSRDEIKRRTKKELIDHLLDDLKGEKAPPGSHDRLLRWWTDNYEQSNEFDIVSELRSGRFLDSVLGTILPKPSDKTQLDLHKKKIEKIRKSILNQLSNRV